MTANERLDAAFGEGFTAEARAEVQREHAERYVQTRAVIEYADTRMVLTRSNAWDDPDMPGAVKVGRSGRDAVLLQESDWNRVVAVARGHVSDAARRVIGEVLAGNLTPRSTDVPAVTECNVEGFHDHRFDGPHLLARQIPASPHIDAYLASPEAVEQLARALRYHPDLRGKEGEYVEGWDAATRVALTVLRKVRAGE